MIGRKINYFLNKIRAYKNYANKLWNISRFVLSSTEGVELKPGFDKYTEKDIELTKEINAAMLDITKDMEAFRFYMAGEKIYQYTSGIPRLVNKLCRHCLIDLESKEIILNGTDEEKLSRKRFLLRTLEKILKILLPFMPFVTEEIWSMFPITNKKLLIVERWPSINK